MPKSRNAQGTGTIRKLSDGRWEARYTVGTNPATGKQVQKSIYGKTQAEVRKKLTATLTTIDTHSYFEPSKLRLSQWLDIWSKDYLIGVKPNTVCSYHSQIKLHIIPALGASRLLDLKPESIQKFYNTLLAQGKSPGSIRCIHNVLHLALSKAEQLHYISHNPTKNLVLPKIIRKQVSIIPDTVLSDFLAAVQGSSYKNVHITTLFTGLRLGEVLGLTWDNINFIRGYIDISKQLSRRNLATGTEYELASTKNNKSRQIVPPKLVFDILSEIKQSQQQSLSDNPLFKNEQNFVFTNSMGRHLIPQSVYYDLKRIVASIGYPSLRFHDLRHTYATIALQNGDNVKLVSENLGHASVSFTLDVYGHVTDTMRNESASRMNQFIESIK